MIDDIRIEKRSGALICGEVGASNVGENAEFLKN